MVLDTLKLLYQMTCKNKLRITYLNLSLSLSLFLTKSLLLSYPPHLSVSLHLPKPEHTHSPSLLIDLSIICVAIYLSVIIHLPFIYLPSLSISMYRQGVGKNLLSKINILEKIEKFDYRKYFQSFQRKRFQKQNQKANNIIKNVSNNVLIGYS